MLLGVGAVATKTYIDDIFSTFLYAETGSTVTVNNSVDMSEGGMVWFKNREATDSHVLVDTVRGGTKVLHSDTTAAESTQSGAITSFNNNGFAIGNYGAINGGSNKDVASWTFRKAPGFFDVVTWTGNSSTTQTISHSLGSIPGMIIAKRTDGSDNWHVYHKGINGGVNPEQYMLRLNTNAAQAQYEEIWGNTAPTATNFVAGEWQNGNGDTYVAYVFAGGESTAATARSVYFSGAYTQRLEVADTNGGWDFGTDAFTIETWFRYDGSSTTSTNDTLFDGRHGTANTPAYYFFVGTDGKVKFTHNNGNYSDTPVLIGTTVTAPGQWYHAAVSKSGSTIKLFVNGVEEDSESDTRSYTMGYPNIGFRGTNAGSSSLTNWIGLISNLRLVKGTAVYTSSFKPPTEPLTNITNTTLLCCNNSSATGSTVTTGTITAYNPGSGAPTASTDSPFDDPAGFVFGDAEDQNVIKCGSYVGAGDTDIDINLGWEPEWVLIKNTSENLNWLMLDSMRGIVSNANDARIYANSADEEVTNGDHIDLTPTGFKVKQQTDSGQVVVYMAIRRPDGYVGKPVELGTGVFAMDTGNSSSTEAFTSGFPVDYVLATNPSSTSVYNWETGGRLIQGKYLYTHNNDAEASHANFDFTSNTGWSKNSGYNSSYQSWMWKRHAGFDVVTYTGNGTAGRQIPHSLSKNPEMMWVKLRSASGEEWSVYHKGLDSGNNPEEKYLYLNQTSAEQDYPFWNDTAPTSTHFTVGDHDGINKDTETYIAMLFASVDGVSKVGYYTGNGTSASSTQTITTGFQPRFVIIKRTDWSNSYTGWTVLDTTRGWGNSADDDDKALFLNNSNAQGSSTQYGEPTSTGFIVAGDHYATNTNNGKYIYYCHA
jgi:hypothetical protein